MACKSVGVKIMSFPRFLRTFLSTKKYYIIIIIITAYFYINLEIIALKAAELEYTHEQGTKVKNNYCN